MFVKGFLQGEHHSMKNEINVVKILNDGYRHKPIKYNIDSNGCWLCTSHYLDSKLSRNDLALKYNVSCSTISRIKIKKSYKKVLEKEFK